MPAHGRSRSRASALLILALLGASLIGAPPAQAAPVVIRGHAVTWSPANVSIVRGGVVKWRAAHLDHNVYAYGSNWSFGASLSEGRSVKHRFGRRGTYRFRCTLHSSLVNGVCSGMCGSVRVA